MNLNGNFHYNSFSFYNKIIYYLLFIIYFIYFRLTLTGNIKSKDLSNNFW